MTVQTAGCKSNDPIRDKKDALQSLIHFPSALKNEIYLFVEHTVDDVEERALLRVENYEHDLEEKVWLVQPKDPGTAQDDELGHNLKQHQSEEERWVCLNKLKVNITSISNCPPCFFGVRGTAPHVRDGGS